MMQPEEIRAIVVETLSAQQAAFDIDAAVTKAISAVLISFGIEDDDRKELRADFAHLRKWRKSVEGAQSLTFKVVLGTIVSGLLGAVWLGIKVLLGK